jgi:hypothetical protein
MSKISLAPDASGTGIFTIASPNSNTNRTLTLPDDTGTIVTNSGNQAGSFTTLNTSGAVVFNDAGADVDFRVESDTDENALFVDGATGNVGIGTSSPSGRNANNLVLQVSSANEPEIKLTATSGDNTFLTFAPDANQNAWITNTQATGSAMIFAVGGYTTERMRITSAGAITTPGTATGIHDLSGNRNLGAVFRTTNANTSAPAGVEIGFSGATPNNTTQYFLVCYDTTNDKALIYSNGDFQSRTNSYGGISDVKLKQDIVDANSQWDDIKGLRIRKYRFKDEVAVDPDYPSHLGVIAQETELVSPGLVFESPDFEDVEVPVLDDEGNPVLNEDGTPQVTTERQATGTVTKGVKYSILYMKAVKALQEAMERIETLEAKVAALETGV